MIPKFQSRGCLAFCALALLVSGCGRKINQAVQNDEGEPSGSTALVSSFKMSDSTAKAQLTNGVYALESGAWRWTAGHFTITFKTPPDAARKGATLTLNLSVGAAVLNQVHSQSLSAAIGSKVLKTEKYVDPGSHTFTADVPASLLTGNIVAVDFSLDNSQPPGSIDRRELGVILTAASLTAN